MSKKVLNGIMKMDSVDFAKELDKLTGKNITANYRGEIRHIHSIENFNFHIEEDINNMEDWLILADENNLDAYIPSICLDAVAVYQKDLISDTLIIGTDGGMVIEFQEC